MCLVLRGVWQLPTSDTADSAGMQKGHSMDLKTLSTLIGSEQNDSCFDMMTVCHLKCLVDYHFGKSNVL
jgi:hypothetical protein